MEDPPLTLHPDERIWLNEYRQAINERHPGAVVRMVVYGSKARGDAHEDSDIDVLIIVKNEAAKLKLPLRRIGYRLSATSYAVPSMGAALLRRRPRGLLRAARQELLDPSKAWWGGRRGRLADRRCHPISVSLGVVPLVLARFVEVPVRIEVAAGS